MHQVKRDRRIKRYLLAQVLLVSGCGSGGGDWSEFPVHPDAEYAQEFNIGFGAGKERYFVVEAVYPDKRVSEFYSEKIGPPWVACNFKDEWESFGSATKEAQIFVHQFLRYWVNYESGRILMLAVRYESEGGEYCEVPDNAKQNVYLVEYKESDIAEAVSRLKLVCNGA